MTDWKEILFSEELGFAEKAARVYEYQRSSNPIYRRFCSDLGAGEAPGGAPYPLLPVRAFKEKKVISAGREEESLLFESSGTGRMAPSRHYVADASLYRESLLRTFRSHYPLDRAVLWAYAPGYAEQPHSSLVWMLRELIRESGSPQSGFLPPDGSLGEERVRQAEKSGRIIILFGAAFGLLDLLDEGVSQLPSNSLVIETGGMKTHRREIGRRELHRRLAAGFGLDYSRVHSEYGMAELLSQAYATGGDWFRPPPWMRVRVCDPNDPRRELPPGREGLIGVIDLANVHSCAFLLTGDRGASDGNGKFRVNGRWNPHNLRGCNFMIDRD